MCAECGGFGGDCWVSVHLIVTETQVLVSVHLIVTETQVFSWLVPWGPSTAQIQQSLRLRGLLCLALLGVARLGREPVAKFVHLPLKIS